jgi:hypothetical protein
LSRRPTPAIKLDGPTVSGKLRVGANPSADPRVQHDRASGRKLLLNGLIGEIGSSAVGLDAAGGAAPRIVSCC